MFLIIFTDNYFYFPYGGKALWSWLCHYWHTC